MLPPTTTIYYLAHPETRQPRYVGKTNNLPIRLKQHIAAKNQSHLVSWIQSLRRVGLTPTINVLEVVDTKDWQTAERAWIRELELLGADLCNGSPGGLGGTNPGHTLSPEGNARRIAALRAVTKGKPLSDETKAKMRAAKLGTHQSPDHIAARAAATRRRYQDPAERAKTAAQLRLVVHGPMSDATKAKISAAKKGKGHPQTDATKAKIGAAHAGPLNHWFGKVYTPEERAVQSVRSKAGWATRRRAATADM